MTFEHFLSILKARWKLSAGVFVAIIVLALLYSLLAPKRYTASASVVVDIKPDPITGLMAGQLMNQAIMATQVDVIQSSRVATRVIRNLQLAENPEIRDQWQKATKGQGQLEDWLSRQFLTQLDVRPSRESNVISIGFQAQDPKFAAALANAFVKAYIETTVELRVDPARQYTTFFDQRAKAARDTLEAASTRLSEYQQQHGIVGSDERLDVETQRLNELTSQLVAIQAISSESNSRQAQARKGQGDKLSESMYNPVLGSLKLELSKAQGQLQELNSRLGDAHPQVIQAKANIAELQSKVDTEMRRATSSVGVTASINSAREAQVQKQLEQQRTKVLRLKEHRDAMAVLQRDIENAQKAYDAIAGRLNQTSLESQAQQSNISVLSPATPPPTASSPKVGLNMALAAFVATLLAVLLALVRELLDRRVRTTTDLAEALELPVLGVLPSPALAQRSANIPMAQRLFSGKLLTARKK